MEVDVRKNLSIFGNLEASYEKEHRTMNRSLGLVRGWVGKLFTSSPRVSIYQIFIAFSTG